MRDMRFTVCDVAKAFGSVSQMCRTGHIVVFNPPWHEDGRVERLELIRERLPGVDDVVTRTPPDGAAPKHLLDAAALLFTARRASGRAISRMPLDPFWDDEGMRMEIVR